MVQIVEGPIESAPVGFVSRTEQRVLVADALAGLELGAWDKVIIEWLAGWDASVVVTIAVWLYRRAG